ncbi:MAG TPA: AMP-binding protein [Archangium sp.]
MTPLPTAPRLAWRHGPPTPTPPAASLWEALLLGDLHAPWLVFHVGSERHFRSRAQLIDHALKWAASITPVPSGRVGVLLPNGEDFIGAFFAAQALGMVAVPLPWPAVDAEPERLRAALEPVVKRAQLDVLCTSDTFARIDWACPTLSPSRLIDARPIQLAPGSAPAFIQFTSGSTGDPRGAVISQQAALVSATAMASALELGPRDVGVSWLPFFHDMGLVGVLLTSLVARFPVHVMRPGDFLFRPRRWLELVSSEQATLTVGPNFAYELAARRVLADGLDLSSLRCALNGSEPVHRATIDRFTEKFAPAGFEPGALLPVYGLAEATLGVAFSRPGQRLRDLEHAGRTVPPAGTLLDGVEVCVCDEHGTPRAEGEEGEIHVRGPTVMNGYFEHPDATQLAMRDDWLRTGDLGVLRDGTLYVTGREKELVVQSGRKFHPYDIERVVADLVEATPNGVAAVSRPGTPQQGEALVVVVELRRASGAIDPMHIKGELLARLGVRADEVQYVPAGTLPRTTSGKVKRKQLAEVRG